MCERRLDSRHDVRFLSGTMIGTLSTSKIKIFHHIRNDVRSRNKRNHSVIRPLNCRGLDVVER